VGVVKLFVLFGDIGVWARKTCDGDLFSSKKERAKKRRKGNNIVSHNEGKIFILV
jgi:hypothetical protein